MTFCHVLFSDDVLLIYFSVAHSTPMYSIPGPVRGNQILISVSQNPLYFFENLDMVSRKLSFLE